jgi:hypothetical protein
MKKNSCRKKPTPVQGKELAWVTGTSGYSIGTGLNDPPPPPPYGGG